MLKLRLSNYGSILVLITIINFSSMHPYLNQLPLNKQQELIEIIALIRAYTEVEIIILFGSYARGDWVEAYAEDGVHLQYQSDYDLLVIVETKSITRQRQLQRALKKLIKAIETIHTPISVIVHDIEYVNRRLTKAQYFFSDIQKEGIILYNSSKFKLEKPKKLPPKDRYYLAKEDFEYSIKGAHEFWIDFNNAFNRQSFENAAFLLHQVTERLYSTILLVFTRYKPNTHNLIELRHLVNSIDPRFILAFPLSTEKDEHQFELLCDAYIDARYNRAYSITQEELRCLSEEVQALQQLTEELCQDKIDLFLTESEIKLI